MMLGLLLARGGVQVTVLEKHGDFLRDFRGDTVHASTLTLLDELGLGERFAALPPRWVERFGIELDSGSYGFGDLTRIPGPHKHIALIPQWDFLDLLADAGRAEPSYTLIMEAEVVDLARDGGVRGVIYRHHEQEFELRADLVVACDGRSSVVCERAGLRPRTFGVPMDVVWFRLPRTDDDPGGGLARLSQHTMIVLIDRGDYFQVGFLIPKGSYGVLQAQGIERFQRRLREALPWLGDRVQTLDSFDEIKLLTVELGRLRRWFAGGLLCIGDAAHVMSPVGGVGINLAIQDAVAAARLLVPAFRTGSLDNVTLRRIQRRRWLPTVITQAFQRLAHRFVVAAQLTTDPGPGDTGRPPLLIALLQRFPFLQRIPATFVGIGVRAEDAPEFARRH
jgi:2-polyprenyl-6-methoxyphenol hydroxylase-like FAD-dependent oxidoreductase